MEKDDEYENQDKNGLKVEESGDKNTNKNENEEEILMNNISEQNKRDEESDCIFLKL